MVRYLVRSSHPGPTVAVTVVAVVLAAAAGAGPWRAGLVGGVILLDQLSVGLSNDWIDADRDRATGRGDKPVALGLVSRRAVAGSAIGTAAASVALSAALGWRLAVVHAVVLVSAWSYNVVLKRTVASVLPFIVSFGLLPTVATLALEPPRPAQWWAFVAGACLGVAAHIANVLPDLSDDAETGVRGLPHRLGRRTAGVVTASATAVAAACVVLGSGATIVGLAGLAGSVALSAAVVVLVLTRPATRLLFRLIIVAALLDVLLLALSGGALVA